MPFLFNQQTYSCIFNSNNIFIYAFSVQSANLFMHFQFKQHFYLCLFCSNNILIHAFQFKHHSYQFFTIFEQATFFTLLSKHMRFCIFKQQRLRQACTNMQTLQCLHCSHLSSHTPQARSQGEARKPGLQQYMGLDARNHDFVTCEQQWCRPACAYAQSGRADQPVHRCSLISAFVIRYLNLCRSNIF